VTKLAQNLSGVSRPQKRKCPCGKVFIAFHRLGEILLSCLCFVASGPRRVETLSEALQAYEPERRAQCERAFALRPGPPGQLVWAVTIQRPSNRPSWTPNFSHRWMPWPSSPM
jgi:hypothetical protein